MPITFTDEEFDLFYSTFEKMMSVESSCEEIYKEIQMENTLWKILRQVKSRAAQSELAPASDLPRSSPA